LEVRKMGITLILALLVSVMALGLGIAVGRWRGPAAGIVTGFGVLVAAGVGYVVVFSLSLPM
jgi:hypothetical protein